MTDQSIIEDAKAAGFKYLAQLGFLSHTGTELDEAIVKFAQLREARQSSQSEPVQGCDPIGWYIKGLDKQDSVKWHYTQNGGDFEYAKTLGLEIEARYAAPQQAIPSGWIPKLGDLVHPSKAVCEKYTEWKPNELLKIVGINYKTLGLGKYSDVVDLTVIEMANEYGATDGWKLEDIVPASPTAPIESDK
jgi:hypothetical protein